MTRRRTPVSVWGIRPTAPHVDGLAVTYDTLRAMECSAEKKPHRIFFDAPPHRTTDDMDDLEILALEHRYGAPIILSKKRKRRQHRERRALS